MKTATPKLPVFPLHGLILLNKHQDISSHSAMYKVRRLFQAEKAGHTGSLDPLATGMLPICLGEATKFSQYLLDADKSYQATGLLGSQTDTADSTGKVIARTESFSVSLSQLQQVLEQFKGEVSQTPSMYSALKFQGRPLYEYARQGIAVDVKARNIAIHDLQLLAFDGQSFTIRVSCSKGTYIRNLVEDIGSALGVGAHLTQLHRLYTAGFANHPMISLDELAALHEDERRGWILAPDCLVSCFPILQLSQELVLSIYQGRVLREDYFPAKAGIYRLYTPEDTFFGLGDLDDLQQLKANRLYNSAYILR